MRVIKTVIAMLGFFCAVGVSAAGIDRAAFDRAIATLRENSYYEINDNDIYRGALQGVMQMLEEKNNSTAKTGGDSRKMEFVARNVLLNPSQAQNLDITARGTLAGVGISIQYEPDQGMSWPVILEVLEGGGKKAGLRARDQLLKINGRPVGEFADLSAMVDAIRGPEGTSVRLTVLRDSEVVESDVTREIIRIAGVESTTLPGGIAYLKINYFNQPNVADARKAITDSIRGGVKKMVVDLRSNGGGLYEAGAEIMAMFAQRGAVVFQERGKIRGKLQPRRVDQDGIAANLSVVALVSEQTASVAEAMAAMFKQRAGSLVMGTTTFGKASIENMFDVGDGYKSLVTVGMLFDRDGQTWHGTGIVPDIQVPRVEGDTDNVLELARDYLQRM
jgi:carboxyl-terminal processing protease